MLLPTSYFALHKEQPAWNWVFKTSIRERGPLKKKTRNMSKAVDNVLENMNGFRGRYRII